MRSVCAALFCASLSIAAAQPGGVSHARGEKLYLEHCAPCHGAGGHDGFAANLAVPKLPHAPDDRSLAKLVRDGFEGTDMPPAFGVTDSDVGDIVNYVRTLGRAPKQKVSGNADRGREIYWGKADCAQCHMVSGAGGRHGPDLSDIGLRRSASHLRQSLVEPEAALPHDFVLVEVLALGGEKIEGVRLNEDSFSIQLRDFAGELHSIRKSGAEIRKQWGKSSMPSYAKTLSSSELDDLTAYLASLRGEL